jgi:hypothetical protein
MSDNFIDREGWEACVDEELPASEYILSLASMSPAEFQAMWLNQFPVRDEEYPSEKYTIPESDHAQIFVRFPVCYEEHIERIRDRLNTWDDEITHLTFEQLHHSNAPMLGGKRRLTGQEPCLGGDRRGA